MKPVVWSALWCVACFVQVVAFTANSKWLLCLQAINCIGWGASLADDLHRWRRP